MTLAQELLAGLREKMAERDRLLRELDLWAAVQAQGVAVDSVDRWGFDSDLLTAKQRTDASRARVRGLPDPFTGDHLPNGHYLPKMYNYVRLKDGSRVILDPMLAAV